MRATRTRMLLVIVGLAGLVCSVYGASVAMARSSRNSREYCQELASDCERNCESGDAAKEAACQRDCARRYQECLNG